MITKTVVTHSNLNDGYVLVTGTPLAIGYQTGPYDGSFVVWADDHNGLPNTVVEFRMTGQEAPIRWRHVGTAQTTDGPALVIHAWSQE